MLRVGVFDGQLEEANFHVRQLGLESDLVVQVDEKQNRVIFRVMKRLNMLQTSKRQIIVDVKRRLLCNQTIHGRTRKQFPMEQIEQIICNPKHQQKVTVKFIKNDLLRNGIVVATGNQRDYELTFATEIMRHQFIKSMEFFLNSTVCHHVLH